MAMTTHRRSVAPRRLTVALLAVIIGGCASASPTAAPATSPRTGASSSSASLPPPVTSAPSTRTHPPLTVPPPRAEPTPSLSCADRTLASLSESQRIGQLFIIGLTKDRLDAPGRDAVAQFHFGSMTFTTQSAAGVAAVRDLTDAIQAQATPSATGGVRFFIAANQEGGLIQGLSGPGFDVIPSALSQGALAPAVLERDAARWGRQLVAAGINLDFAPVADVVPPGTDAQNAPIGQLKREFAHDPATVSSHVAAFVAGMREAGVATTVKHFPGLGRVTGNTDFTADVTDSVTTRDDAFIGPFARAMRARVPFVMVSLATYERIDARHLAVFSPIVMRGMLRDDLGYRGVIVSDALDATAVAAIPPATRAVDFLDAGGDMMISNELAPAIEMADALAARAETTTSFRERVDDAALHVLRAKEAAGLLPCAS
jgi:beta-N-acetylhexosaminidase